MFFSNNIKRLRKRRKKTQEDLAKLLNMKRSTLSGYENNIAQPGIEALVAFSDYFKIAIDTLIRVNMEALSESQLSELENGYDAYVRGSRLRVLTTSITPENEENIELVPEKAKAGYTQGFADPDFIANLPGFSLPFLDKQKKYRSFQLSGDSMLPIPHGAWVTGEFVQDWLNLKNGEACVILTLNEGIVFKVVENRLQAERKLRLHSLNPEYKSYDIAVNEIREIWIFAHFISQELPEPEIPRHQIIEKIKKLQLDIEALRSQ